MNNDNQFLGIMVLKDGKWTPHSKFNGDALVTALTSAEELDKTPDFDAVKVVRISKTDASVQKEMWVSPRLKARTKAQEANKLRDGLKKTQENLAADRKNIARE